MDDENKQKEQESTKKTATTGLKAGANAVAGPFAGKAVDLANKTKVGNSLLNAGSKALNPVNPAMGKKTNPLNQEKTVTGTGKSENDLDDGKEEKENSEKDEKSSGSSLPTKLNVPSSNSTEADSEESNGVSYFNAIFSYAKNHKILFITIGGSFLLMLLFIILILVIVISPVTAVHNFFTDVGDFFIGLFTKDLQEWEQEYYEELEKVQSQISRSTRVCVDVNLITASLTVDMSMDDFLTEGQSPDESGEIDTNNIPYKKMIKQVKLLANMQIKRKRYGWNKNLTSRYSGRCDAGTANDVLVTADNADSYDENSFSYFSSNGLDSSTPELVAQHDLTGFSAFFTKKTDEERNYEFHLYQPAPYEIEIPDDHGGKKKVLTCGNLPSEQAELSIGDLSTMEDSVFYWNLVNSFIPEYYAEYLPSNEAEKKEKAKEIAEEIYLLYNDIGPSQSCSMTSSYICRSDEGAEFYGGGESSQSRTQFLENASPVAIEEMTRTGVFASITLAQAALESGNGSSTLSAQYSNYYGMTAGNCAPPSSPDNSSGVVYQAGEGGNSCQGNAFWNGSVVAMCNKSGGDCQWYRIYDSFANSARDHSRLLADSYNCNVYGSYEEQLNCLVDHGYATDTSYASKVASVIHKYNLADYDIGTWDGTIVPVSESQYSNNLCYSNGVSVAGEFSSWKQYNKAWSNVPLGNKTVGEIGCAMTSVCIQIMRSGASILLDEEFNPGTFAQRMTAINGFDRIGNIYWDKVSSIAPDFQFVNRVTKNAQPSEISNLVDQGYYVILNVKNGRHWVAVDRVENNKIYMLDPGSEGTEVGETYGLGSIVGYAYYRKV